MKEIFKSPYTYLALFFVGRYYLKNKPDSSVSKVIREVTEAKASAELCKSSKPNDALSASDLSSCKSQGLRARETKRKYKIGGQTQGISGKKVRGKKYGGNLPAHGKKNQDNARKGKAEG